MSTVRLGFHYVGIFVQWFLVFLAVFLVCAGNGLQDYTAAIVFLLVALFLRIRMVGAWAQRTMVIPLSFYTQQQVKASGHEISVYESAAVFTSRQCPCKHGSHDTQPHASMT